MYKNNLQKYQIKESIKKEAQEIKDILERRDCFGESCIQDIINAADSIYYGVKETSKIDEFNSDIRTIESLYEFIVFSWI